MIVLLFSISLFVCKLHVQHIIILLSQLILSLATVQVHLLVHQKTKLGFWTLLSEKLQRLQ